MFNTPRREHTENPCTKNWGLDTDDQMLYSESGKTPTNEKSALPS